MIEAVKAKQTNNKIDKTLKGVLLNNHIKNDKNISFDEIKDTLLIHENKQEQEKQEQTKKESSFDAKKALLPVIVGTTIAIGACAGLSGILKKSSKNLLNSKTFEQLPDLAVNMNIREETHFALYRAIRDPNYKNILGAVAVGIMSGITFASKKFVDGTKEIWLKKKEADVEKNLQENLIAVETSSFSGKLNVINELMNKNIKHFDEVLNKKKPSVFDQFKHSFKGNQQQKEPNELKKNLIYAGITVAGLIGAIALGKVSINNIRKTAQNTNEFANKLTEKTIDAIQNMSNKADKKDIPTVETLLKSICAKPEFVKEIGEKYNLSADEIQKMIDSVAESKKTIFSDAPTALGGIPKKIQYYCYLDENKGHLYNWILNPENKFTKYIFGAFTLSSAIGYTAEKSMEALKDYTVMKENAKTELDLRKRLVDVEIKNFKSKKESAINPLIENFDKQAQEGKKSKEELKQIADNILYETKNGPPYVYA